METHQQTPAVWDVTLRKIRPRSGRQVVRAVTMTSVKSEDGDRLQEEKRVSSTTHVGRIFNK